MGKTEGRSEEEESQRVTREARDNIFPSGIIGIVPKKRARTLRITGCRNPSHRHLTQPTYTNFPIAQRDFDGPVVVHGSRLGEGDDELALHIAFLSFFVFRAFNLSQSYPNRPSALTLTSQGPNVQGCVARHGGQHCRSLFRSRLWPLGIFPAGGSLIKLLTKLTNKT